MSDPDQSSDLPPAPLDAYVTAKPDEPTFTLQGGDPLAPLLVELWIVGARGLCGLDPQASNFLERWIATQESNQVAEHERPNLLRRASAAEEVLWSIKDYQAGRGSADAEAEPNPDAENSSGLDEAARLDLHDVRVRYAQRVSGMVADLNAIRAELIERHFFMEDSPLDHEIIGTVGCLSIIRQQLEPRRLMKQSG